MGGFVGNIPDGSLVIGLEWIMAFARLLVDGWLD
jgi:hypothetical protein